MYLPVYLFSLYLSQKLLPCYVLAESRSRWSVCYLTLKVISFTKHFASAIIRTSSLLFSRPQPVTLSQFPLLMFSFLLFLLTHSAWNISPFSCLLIFLFLFFSGITGLWLERKAEFRFIVVCKSTTSDAHESIQTCLCALKRNTHNWMNILQAFVIHRHFRGL